MKSTQFHNVIVGALLFVAFIVCGFGQTSAPAASEVTQIAYEAADDAIPDGDWQTYTDDAYIRSEPKWKSKHFLHLARLLKWSPDGQNIAFLTPCQGSFFYASTDSIDCVQVANQDGSHRILLSHYPTKVSGELMVTVNFTWSPGGKEVAYIDEGRTWTTISTVGIDGSGGKEIQRLRCVVLDANLDWSPDGKKLAFTGCSGMGRPTISVFDFASGTTKEVAEGASPLWSPDGKMLLFRKAGLTIINSDGTQERRILDGEPARYGLTWLQSGRSIAFGSTRENSERPEIFRMNIDGTGLQKVASGARNGLSFSHPIFSPDEQKLIVFADACLPSSCSASDVLPPPELLFFAKRRRLVYPPPGVVLIDLSTSKEKRLVDGFLPTVMWGRK